MAQGSVFKRIWLPFIYLFLLTVLEFAIAFTFPKEEYGTFRNWTFIIMTLVKAFFIVAYFMHLKFERVKLIYTILIPVIFVIYLIILLLIEGGDMNY